MCAWYYLLIPKELSEEGDMIVNIASAFYHCMIAKKVDKVGKKLCLSFLTWHLGKKHQHYNCSLQPGIQSE